MCSFVSQNRVLIGYFTRCDFHHLNTPFVNVQFSQKYIHVRNARSVLAPFSVINSSDLTSKQNCPCKIFKNILFSFNLLVPEKRSSILKQIYRLQLQVYLRMCDVLVDIRH